MSPPSAALHYARVWQTWELVCPQAQHDDASLSTNNADVDSNPTSTSDSAASMRQKVQRARIEQRMSIAALAAEVMSTTETIAAFERGDGVLGTDVRARIFKVLKLT